MTRYVLHAFRPTETIDAVLRLLGRHNLTKPEILKLRKEFDRLNGLIVPRAGDVYKIPLPFEVVDDHGNVVDVTPTDEPEEIKEVIEAKLAPEPKKPQEPKVQSTGIRIGSIQNMLGSIKGITKINL